MTLKSAGTQKTAGSKFSGLLAAANNREETDRAETESVEPAAAAKTADVGKPAGEEARRGRPRGKRSSDEFVQVTAYIEKETHRAVKMALLREGEGREFSELVEELLAGWTTART